MNSRLSFSTFTILLFLLSSSCFAQINRLDYPLEQIWEFQADEREVTSYDIRFTVDFKLSEQYLYAASMNGVLYCFQKQSGDLVWSFSTGYPLGNTFSLSSDNSIVILPVAEKVFALDSQTGELVWLYSARSQIVSGIVSGEKAVYFTTESELTSLDAKKGNEIWQYDLEGEQFLGRLYFQNNSLFTSSGKNHVFRFNAETGNRIWSVEEDSLVRSGYAVTNDRVFYGTDSNYIVCASLSSGKTIWRQRVTGDVRSGITVYDNQVYFYSRDRFLRVFNVNHGGPGQFGPFQLISNYQGTPVISDGHLQIISGTIINSRIVNQNFFSTNSEQIRKNISNSLLFDEDLKAFFFGTTDGYIQMWAPESNRVQLPTVQDQNAAITQPILEDSIGLPDVQDSRPEIPVNNSENVQPDNTSGVIEKEERVKTEVTGKTLTEKDIQEKPDADSPAKSTDNSEIEAPQDQKPVETKDTQEIVQESQQTDTKDPESSVESVSIVANPSALIANAQYSQASAVLKKNYASVAEHRFTISVGLFCREDSLGRLWNQFNAEHTIMVFERNYNESTCYFFCIDLFEDKENAQSKLSELKADYPSLAQARVYQLDSFIP